MKFFGIKLWGKEKNLGLPVHDNHPSPPEKLGKKEVENDFEIRKKVYGNPPPGRISSKDTQISLNVPNIWNHEIPDFNFQVIPLIRKLSIINEDVGQVVFDLMQLCNTGYEISFDKKVKPNDVDKMRRHLYNRSKVWTDGVAGTHGLINKMIHQILIGGALSNEWVINKDLTGIDNIFLIKPETIRWVYNKRKNRYEPYQYVETATKPEESMIKLNQFTYRYYGLMGDTELPYGIPLYIPALKRVTQQMKMDKNIDFVMEQLGLLGFFEAKLEKPSQNLNENDKVYEKRLNRLLLETKRNLQAGMSDGVTVGFQDEHEFQFHSTTKNLSGVSDIYNQVLSQVAKGLKHPQSFLGISSGSTETHINIIFTKMLAQLWNIQNLVKQNLEFGYALELRLAGFNFDFLEINFKESTITDELKSQQAREILIRNLLAEYNQGIISQETMADLLGREEPDQKEPRQTIEPGEDPAKKKQDREKQKDDSDRRVREKNKPQPKRKDQDTKKV